MLPFEDQPDAMESDAAFQTWPDVPLNIGFMPAPKKIRKPDPEEIVLRMLVHSLQSAQRSPRPEVAEVACHYEKHFQAKLNNLLVSEEI